MTCTLKHHVLDHVGHSQLVGLLIARTNLQPEAGGNRTYIRDGFGQDPNPICEHRFLQSLFPLVATISPRPITVKCGYNLSWRIPGKSSIMASVAAGDLMALYPGKEATMSQTLVVVLLSLMLFISNLFGGSADITGPGEPLPSQEQTYTVPGRIRNSPVTLYDSPSTESKQVASGQPNTSISLLAESGDWYKIQLPDGTTGWVLKILVSTSGNTGLLAKEVYGYFVQNTSLPSDPSLAANYKQMTGITPWAFSLDAEGNVVNQMEPSTLAKTLGFAGERGMKTLALISNYDKRTESFSGALAHNLLKSPANRRRAVDNIYKTAVNWGICGINLDFEHVYPSDREYFSQFLRELSNRLKPAGIMVTVAIPAKTHDDPSSSWSGAFDYKAIGQAVDRVMLMAYDQHYPGGAPGPIASISWVDRVLQFAVSQIPREKLILGIAGYGYSWKSAGNAYSVAYQKAIELAAQGSGIRWDATHKAPFALYNGREMWFENAASISYKLDLVNKYNIKGVTLWRLGQEDPQMWQVVAGKLSA